MPGPVRTSLLPMIEVRLATPGKRIEQGLQPSPTAGIGQTPADLDDRTAVRERLERPRRPSRLALRSAAPARAVDGGGGNGLTGRTCLPPSFSTARGALGGGGPKPCGLCRPAAASRAFPAPARFRAGGPPRGP